MRPRSLPWLALHLFAIVAGAVSLIGALGTPSEALQTPYGQGALAGRLIWVAIAALVIRKLVAEYGRPDGASAVSSNPAFVPTARPRSSFECDAFGPPAAGYGTTPGYAAATSQSAPAAFYAPPAPATQTAYPTPPAYGPGSSYMESSSPFRGLPPTHAAAPALRGSVAPPGL